MLQDLRYAIRSLAAPAAGHQRWPCCRWRSASASTPPSSRSSTGCCCAGCRCPRRTKSSCVTSPGPDPGRSRRAMPAASDAIFSYPLFRDLERLEADGLAMAAHRDFGANLAYRGPDVRRRRAARLRPLLPGSRCHAGAGPAARARRRSRPRRTSGRRAEPRLLEHALWRRSVASSTTPSSSTASR